MNSPQPPRRDIRYPLHMPVTLKLGQQSSLHLTPARSENISLRGILLSSASLIPEGSLVEVAVGVATLPEHAVQLSARGKVLRVQPRPAGNFAMAIEFERPFVLDLQTTGGGAAEKHSRSAQTKSRTFIDPRPRLCPAWYASAWHMET